MSDAPPPSRPTPRWRPIQQLACAWIRESFREPQTLFWLYGFPIVLAIVLGVAFQNKLSTKIEIDVQDGPGAEATANVLRGREDLAVHIHDAETCRQRLRTGRTDAVVVATVAAPPAYQCQIIRSRPEGERARDLVDELLQKAAGRRDAAQVTSIALSEPGSRYIDFLIPGLLGMSLMQGALSGVALLTVELRIRKLLKRFVATPMRKSDFLAAILLSRLWFVFTEVFVILLFGRMAFGVASQGNWLAVTALLLLGTVSFVCVGLLVGSRATTWETANGLMSLVLLPMWVFSGILFSTDRFPAAAQPLIRLLPLTPLINALRAVMLEGASLTSQFSEIGALVAWALVSFVLALRWFRWT
jgi:ABC-2 type transport system permease protein